MEKKKLAWQIPFLLLLIAGTILILRKQTPFQTNHGRVFGTVYKATYQYGEDLQQEIEAELKKVDDSLSPFNDSSVISRVNRNEDIPVDSMFVRVFERSEVISRETGGAFDITVAPLVNAWGFGFKKGAFPDSARVDSLLEITGYRKVKLEGGKIMKEDPRIMLTCSAIAKGFGTDAVARLFDRKGIRNYMIDIGGEIVVKGENPKMAPWRIGINKPVDDSLSVNQDLEIVLQINDGGMATSGNYRNYYYKDGKKYAHTIDPCTGYPVQHNILSATVIASDCMSADAYATAFMVMGLEQAEAFAQTRPEIDVYFIYSDEKGQLKTYYTKGMEKYMKGERKK